MRERERSFPLFSELQVPPQQHVFVFNVLRTILIKSGNLGTTDLTYSAIRIYRRLFRTPRVN